MLGLGRCRKCLDLADVVNNGRANIFHLKAYNPAMLGLAITGAAIFGVGVTALYQSVAPRARWYGRGFTGLPSGAKLLALTYDDGPNDPHSLHLLEVLSKHGARATFFMIGQYVQSRPDIVREVAKAGHVIGN